MCPKMSGRSGPGVSAERRKESRQGRRVGPGQAPASGREDARRAASNSPDAVETTASEHVQRRLAQVRIGGP